MRPFDLEQLRTLVTIVEQGSLSAAAPLICRSQSAISDQLKKLEEFAATPLLIRSKKGVSPTPAGERLIVHARKMLALSDHALEDMRGLALNGELRLAITDYFRPAAIAEILKRIQLSYPQLRLHVMVRKSLQIERGVEEQEFDIGLSMRILDGKSLEEGTPIRRERLAWVAETQFEWNQSKPLPLLSLPEGCSLQRFILQTLDAYKVPYVVAHSASGVAGLHSALVAGLGVACLNGSAVPQGVSRFQALSALPSLPEVEFSLLPPRHGESELVTEARQMLASQLA